MERSVFDWGKFIAMIAAALVALIVLSLGETYFVAQAFMNLRHNATFAVLAVLVVVFVGVQGLFLLRPPSKPTIDAIDYTCMLATLAAVAAIAATLQSIYREEEARHRDFYQRQVSELAQLTPAFEGKYCTPSPSFGAAKADPALPSLCAIVNRASAAAKSNLIGAEAERVWRDIAKAATQGPAWSFYDRQRPGQDTVSPPASEMARSYHVIANTLFLASDFALFQSREAQFGDSAALPHIEDPIGGKLLQLFGILIGVNAIILKLASLLAKIRLAAREAR